MDNEGLHVCDVCEQRENFESVDERLCFLSAALDVEREDGSAAVREILLIKLVVRAVRQRRMVDAFDLRVLGEEIDNLQRVLYMAFNAQRERFKTLQEQECVQRSERCAGITQEDCTDLRDKGCRADILCEADAVVAGVRLYEGRELAAAFPVKLTAVYDNAADRRAVTADELCSGMDNNVCAVLERTEEVRRCECGVYNKRNLMSMCNGCDLFNVNQRCVRVTDGLDEDGLCLIVNRVFKSALFVRVYERCGDAVLRERVLEQMSPALARLRNV